MKIQFIDKLNQHPILMAGDPTETFTSNKYTIPRKGEKLLLKSGWLACESAVLDVIYNFKSNEVLVKLDVDNSLQYKWEIGRFEMHRIFIIFPKGDKTKLAFGVDWYSNRDEWSLASRQDFSYDEEGTKQALEYGRELANKHNLPLDVSNISEGGHDFLD